MYETGASLLESIYSDFCSLKSSSSTTLEQGVPSRPAGQAVGTAFLNVVQRGASFIDLILGLLPRIVS